MKIFLCTISFRHHLVSLEDLAGFAAAEGFAGLELWGAHARNLADRPDRDAAWLAGLGLCVPMVSDYLPLDGDPDLLRRRTLSLCALAKRWRAPKIRSFAGSRSSRATSPEARRAIVQALREAAALAADEGLDLLIETHPDTLADCGRSTLALLDEVDHPGLKINFDALHVWEGGDDPVALHRALKPYIRHHHLKNIRARSDLAVFQPANVYAAAGSRDGMTPLFEGELDYRRFAAAALADGTAEVSLEWFGPDAFAVLSADRAALVHHVDALLRPPAPPPRRAAGLR